jgi:hypothetical protein
VESGYYQEGSMKPEAEDPDLSAEIDFSKATRGLHHIPGGGAGSRACINRDERAGVLLRQGRPARYRGVGTA